LQRRNGSVSKRHSRKDQDNAPSVE
jgi:hypothetical protein